jgi:hypothetical protein
VHRIDRAAGGVGGDGGEQGGIEDAKAHFLAFHVAVRAGDAELLVNRIARASPTRQNAREKQNHHRAQTDQPCAWFLVMRPR